MSAVMKPAASVFTGPADRDMTESPATVVERDLLATLDPVGARGRVWISTLLAFTGLALAAWITQLVFGLRVTAMRDIVSWGAYMTNFVFFIGISHAGTLISAILRVTNAGWRRPITRMAEAITVFALLVGASMVVIDMGRPDRVLFLLRYGRLQSPIMWDLVSVTTYLTGSFLYLYVAMIPDMPILARAARARGRSRTLVRLYELLSLGYRECDEHRRLLARALGAMAVIIIPVAVSVHTVVSWVFGMTLRPGWHSTIFGPYFVIGAIWSGTAAIITAMVLFRRAYHLEHYITAEHFRKLATLLLALSLLYAYFTLSEYLTSWYGGTESDSRLLELLAGNTSYGTTFWLWAAFGLFLPIGLLLFPSRRSIGSVVTASVLINIGMWLKRYLIVVPTLQTPFIPPQSAGITPSYFPSVVEITITVGGFAAFLLLFTLFSRVFPILSIWETAEDAMEQEGEGEKAGAESGAAPERGAPVAVPVLPVVGALLVAAALATPASRAAAQSDSMRIALSRAVEDSAPMLVARVTRADKPVANALVRFSVKRTFGWLKLGEDHTIDDGTAAVPFPADLPGDARRNLEVSATASVDTARATVTQTMAGGALPRPVVAVTPPRALWSSRAPLAMVATIIFLALCVWSTYLFVVSQLVAIYRTRATLLVLAFAGTAALARPARAQVQAPDSSTVTSVPWVAPARAARVTNPVAATRASVAAGRGVYQEQCAMCHGARGRGDGDLARNLPTHPGDFTSAVVQRQSDGALYWKISEGRNVMPGMREALTDSTRWSLVNYLRTLRARR